VDPKIVRMLYVFPVLRDRPDLGVKAGEVIAYDPRDTAGPWSRTERITPDHGAILAALNAGDLGGEIPPQLLREAPPPLEARGVLRLLRTRAHRRPA
jgi:hypothetical protein